MNASVNKLLDVDREARQTLDEAQQYYDQTLLEIQEEKAQMLLSYTQRAEKHLTLLKAELDSEVDETMKSVRERTAELLAQMDAHYEEHHQQWEDQMVQKCIGR